MKLFPFALFWISFLLWTLPFQSATANETDHSDAGLSAICEKFKNENGLHSEEKQKSEFAKLKNDLKTNARVHHNHTNFMSGINDGAKAQIEFFSLLENRIAAICSAKEDVNKKMKEMEDKLPANIIQTPSTCGTSDQIGNFYNLSKNATTLLSNLVGAANRDLTHEFVSKKGVNINYVKKQRQHFQSNYDVLQTIDLLDTEIVTVWGPEMPNPLPAGDALNDLREKYKKSFFGKYLGFFSKEAQAFELTQQRLNENKLKFDRFKTGCASIAPPLAPTNSPPSSPPIMHAAREMAPTSVVPTATSITTDPNDQTGPATAKTAETNPPNKTDQAPTKEEGENFFQRNKTELLVGGGLAAVAGGALWYYKDQEKKKKKKEQSTTASTSSGSSDSSTTTNTRSLRLTGSPNSAKVGKTLTPILAYLVDKNGNPVQDAGTTITVSCTAACSLSGTLSKASAAGAAEFSDLKFGSVQTGVQLRFSATGIDSITTPGSFNVTE